LIAAETFHQQKPVWAPGLPLCVEDCEKLENTDDHRLNLVGYYSSSLRHTYWDEHHPRFPKFAAGLLAHERAPRELRTDCELLREFPPCRLDDLNDELVWCSPEQLAQDRQMLALIAAADAHRARKAPDSPISR
jgi:hypothetical protein